MSTTGWSKRAVPGFPTVENDLGQGRENCKQFLLENPDIAAEIEEKIRIALGLIQPQLKEVEGGKSS